MIIWRAGNRAAFWLLAGAAAAALSAYIGALDGTALLIHTRAGARYAFVPLSLTALSFLALAAGNEKVWRWPAAAICAWLLIVGTRAYTHPWQPGERRPVMARAGRAVAGRPGLCHANLALAMDGQPRAEVIAVTVRTAGEAW